VFYGEALWVDRVDRIEFSKGPLSYKFPEDIGAGNENSLFEKV
jgi:hypothetical protein